jgi:hypothetical protein
MESKKGMIGGIVSLIVAIIAIVAVAIPISTSVVDSANLTGINATIVEYIPTFLALAGLALVAGMVRTG